MKTGSAHFFTLTAGAWVHSTTFVPPEAQDNDRFAEAVACDVYVVGGAPDTEGASLIDSGAAYVTVPQ